MKCKYPDEVCASMTVLNGVAYCDSVPCVLRGEIPPMTNADRIRSMGDEELYDFLRNVKSRTRMCQTLRMDDVELCSLEWLRQPAEEAT